MFALLRRVMEEEQLDGLSSKQLNPAKMPFIDLALVRLVNILKEEASKTSGASSENAVSIESDFFVC
jgi:hypothetical protein